MDILRKTEVVGNGKVRALVHSLILTRMYIRIDPILECHVDTTAMADGFTIEAIDSLSHPSLYINGRTDESFLRFAEITLSELTDERLTEEQRRPTSALSFPPDSWLIALTYVMWEGIVSGASWDGFKHVIQRHLAYLQSAGVAPRRKDDRKSKRDFNLYWSGYIELPYLMKLWSKLEIKFKSTDEYKRRKRR